VSSKRALARIERRPARPIFALKLRAESGNSDPVRNLRALLKLALRRYRLRCVEIVEVRERGP
jgi:hypothetical protein